MDRDEKKKSAETLHEELKKAKGVILSKFQGITVAQDFELRRKVAGSGARYKVVKNSLIERAAKGTTVEPIAQKLAGTTSVALTEADPVALARVLTEYAKGNPVFSFKCGVVEGRVVSLADLNALATLPSKEQLLSKVLFLFNSPAQRVASTLSGVARNLAYVIQQAVQLKKFGVRSSSPESEAEQGAVEQGSNDAYRAVERAIDHVFNGPEGFRREHGRGFVSSLRAREVDPHNFDDALPDLMSEGRNPPGGPGLTPSVQDLAAELSVPQRDTLRQHYLQSLQKFEGDFPQDTLGGT